jgi:ferritin-like metal-binding protein YciE
MWISAQKSTTDSQNWSNTWKKFWGITLKPETITRIVQEWKGGIWPLLVISWNGRILRLFELFEKLQENKGKKLSKEDFITLLKESKSLSVEFEDFGFSTFLWIATEVYENGKISIPHIDDLLKYFGHTQKNISPLLEKYSTQWSLWQREVNDFIDQLDIKDDLKSHLKQVLESMFTSSKNETYSVQQIGDITKMAREIHTRSRSWKKDGALLSTLFDVENWEINEKTLLNWLKWAKRTKEAQVVELLIKFKNEWINEENLTFDERIFSQEGQLKLSLS